MKFCHMEIVCFIIFLVLCLTSSIPLQTSPKLVMVIGQMRGGTSIVGELFNQYPGSMYFFEPLRAIGREKTNDTESLYRNMKGYPVGGDAVSEVITHLFECKVTNFSMSILKDDFMLRSEKGVNYYRCANMNSILRMRFQQCLDTFRDGCYHESLIRAVKTIRLTFDTAERIMTLLPNLKIIYLVRDPRAIIQSRLSLGIVNTNSIEEEANELCVRVQNDLELIKISKKQNHIKVVQYETFAKNVIEGAKNIFDFVGIKMQNKVLNFINTHSMKALDINPFSTSRNSVKSVDSWVHKINTVTANIIDKSCDHLLNNLGYKYFNDIKN